MSKYRKFIREIERRAGVQIISISHTGSGHLRLCLPCGVITASATPSCPFAIQNIIGDIRRAQLNQNKEARRG